MYYATTFGEIDPYTVGTHPTIVPYLRQMRSMEQTIFLAHSATLLSSYKHWIAFTNTQRMGNINFCVYKQYVLCMLLQGYRHDTIYNYGDAADSRYTQFIHITYIYIVMDLYRPIDRQTRFALWNSLGRAGTNWHLQWHLFFCKKMETVMCLLALV